MARMTRNYSKEDFHSIDAFDTFRGFPDFFQRIPLKGKFSLFMSKMGQEVSFWLVLGSLETGALQGRIQGILKNKTLTIETTEKVTPLKGFYGIMFPAILSSGFVNRIESDTKLSPAAFGSYQKLQKTQKKMNIKVKTEDGILDFNKKNIFADAKNRIIVEGILGKSESFIDYFR